MSAPKGAPRIGYAGMTHLGLCSSIAAASKCFDTVCFDPDGARIAALQKSEMPVIEPICPSCSPPTRLG